MLNEISFKTFWDIPWILVHCFQIIVNFLYVCQSGNWLTSLLILDKYRDISSSGWDNFLKLFETFPGWWYTSSKYMLIFLMSYQSVSCLTSLLKLDIKGDISSSWWNIFLKIFWHIPRIFLDYLQIISNFFYVCHCVSWLTSFLKLS